MQDYVSNNEVLKKARLPRIEAILLQVQLRWAVHISKMEAIRMPTAVFVGKFRERKRDRGAPRKRYKDQLKRQLAQAGINQQSWQQEASDRDSRHSSVRKASRVFEAERHEAAKQRGRRQKEQAASHWSPAQTFACPKCSRICVLRMGLYRHQRAARTEHQPSQNLRLRGISHRL